MWTAVKALIGIVVSSIATTLFAALRKKRRDQELKEAAKNEVYLEAERKRNETLKKWQNLSPLSKPSLVSKLRDGKF